MNKIHRYDNFFEMLGSIGVQIMYDNGEEYEILNERYKNLAEDYSTTYGESPYEFHQGRTPGPLSLEELTKIKNWLELTKDVHKGLKKTELIQLYVSESGEYCFKDGSFDHGPISSYFGSADTITDLVDKIKNKLKPAEGEKLQFSFYILDPQITDQECAEFERLFYQQKTNTP